MCVCVYTYIYPILLCTCLGYVGARCSGFGASRLHHRAGCNILRQAPPLPPDGGRSRRGAVRPHVAGTLSTFSIYICIYIHIYVYLYIYMYMYIIG